MQKQTHPGITETSDHIHSSLAMMARLPGTVASYFCWSSGYWVLLGFIPLGTLKVVVLLELSNETEGCVCVFVWAIERVEGCVCVCVCVWPYVSIIVHDLLCVCALCILEANWFNNAHTDIVSIMWLWEWTVYLFQLGNKKKKKKVKSEETFDTRAETCYSYSLAFHIHVMLCSLTAVSSQTTEPIKTFYVSLRVKMCSGKKLKNSNRNCIQADQ